MTNWQKTLDKNILNWRDVTAAELPEHLFKWLEKTCWEQRNKKLDILKMNDKLVGHIKEEYRIPEYPKEFEEFIDILVIAIMLVPPLELMLLYVFLKIRLD